VICATNLRLVGGAKQGFTAPVEPNIDTSISKLNTHPPHDFRVIANCMSAQECFG
jgi:hypothetical protein